jgi:hypothetical protein
MSPYYLLSHNYPSGGCRIYNSDIGAHRGTPQLQLLHHNHKFQLNAKQANLSLNMNLPDPGLNPHALTRW